MLIRAATTDDAVPLAVLSGQLGYPADAATVLRRLDGVVSHQAGVVLVAVDDQHALSGFAHVEPRHLLVAEPFAELAALVVSENARGQGVGNALLAAVETWTRERGFSAVRVRSNVVRERAHRFYLRAGYSERKWQAVFVKSL
ncbi:MAG TPA: GNAT family N-acetyltransferase [Rhodanobacteraceae bacterium]|jgi:GNAT superfamily N-acetyltransferase|nr:GNAT family N-acetyltransferase [Rhodanobacteraceae bacterium]